VIATGLCPRNSFVLQNSDYHATVVGLSLRALVSSNLLAGSHGPGRKHVRQGDVALLFQKFGHVIGTLCAEFLVQCSKAYGRREALLHVTPVDR